MAKYGVEAGWQSCFVPTLLAPWCVAGVLHLERGDDASWDEETPLVQPPVRPRRGLRDAFGWRKAFHLSEFGLVYDLEESR